MLLVLTKYLEELKMVGDFECVNTELLFVYAKCKEMGKMQALLEEPRMFNYEKVAGKRGRDVANRFEYRIFRREGYCEYRIFGCSMSF